MDSPIYYSRTDKGREELLGSGRTLKPRQRQVLFLVTDNISLDTLKQKLPSCQELENILTQLWNEGYIDQIAGDAQATSLPQDQASIHPSAELNTGPKDVPAPEPGPASSPNPGQLNGIGHAKVQALEIVASLVGERSPIYAKINDTHNRADFIQAVSAGRKVIAAVASASRAKAFEEEILALLQP